MTKDTPLEHIAEWIAPVAAMIDRSGTDPRTPARQELPPQQGGKAI
ncbi:hypothetical protein QCD71_03465 [Sphingomonas sp. PsM26]|nr:hypothetical protein [Sphingomonas sp. PsM26]